jgi:hypothetical protein
MYFLSASFVILLISVVLMLIEADITDCSKASQAKDIRVYIAL